MSAGLRVLGGKVLVEPITKPIVSASGIELTDEQPPTYGRIVGIGTKHRCPECEATLPVEVRLGAIVGFPWNAGQDVTMNGEPFVVLNIGDLQFEWTPDTAQESA